MLNAADYFTNATPGNHKPRSTVNHFGGSLGGPIVHDKLFFFFDSEWVRIALPIVTPTTVPTPASSITSCSNFRWRNRLRHRVQLSRRRRNWCRSIRQMFSLYGNTNGTPLAVLGCPFNADGCPLGGNAADGNGCANRQSVSHSSDDHEQVQTVRIDYNINQNRYHMVSLSGRHWTASCVHRSHQPALQRDFAAASLLFRGGIHARVLAESGELLQSGVLLV